MYHLHVCEQQLDMSFTVTVDYFFGMSVSHKPFSHMKLRRCYNSSLTGTERNSNYSEHPLMNTRLGQIIIYM